VKPYGEVRVWRKYTRRFRRGRGRGIRPVRTQHVHDWWNFTCRHPNCQARSPLADEIAPGEVEL
jgi:hypothetical protein